MNLDIPIVVFCHLRWNFVFQRPQHVLSRLAKSRRVILIEEPEHASECRWELSSPLDNLTVCKPLTSVQAPGFHDEQLRVLGPMLTELLAGVRECVAWFYTPLALPLLDSVHACAVVYDCMDELSAFLHAPPQLLEREKELLSRADLVFTGGPSLYEAKKNRHPNVHCFSSSVDTAHFGKAKPQNKLEEAPEQRDLPSPKLGFFGVIDERFDVPLLAAMAAGHPEWQLCMVGPIVKIAPESLPRAENIHYFGQRSYAQLPSFLTGWDVCLLPFARNDSTRFISPTKTLEYMAAERPIVSTPITDVAKPYGDIVYLGDTPDQFIKCCEDALHSTEAERAQRIQKMRGVLANTSWDRTAQAMLSLIDEVLVSKSESSSKAIEKAGEIIPPVLVIGGGPTGLSAGYHLGEDGLVLEANGRTGGWCRSIQDNGFTFDFAGHIMFSNDPVVHDLYKLLLGDNVHWQNREAWIYSHNVYTRYPFQGALYGLPPDVIKDCITGAIEARFGNLKEKKAESSEPKQSAKEIPPVLRERVVYGNGIYANGSVLTNGIGVNGRTDHPNGNGFHSHGNGVHINGNGAHTNGNGTHGRINSSPSECKSESITDCCADGICEADVELGKSSSEPRNFEEFIYKVWGKGIAKHFAIPYNRKLWAVPLSEMETSWLGGRVPMPDLEEMIEGALRPVAKPMGPNARFGYPLKGGFQALMDGFLPHMKNKPRLHSKVVSVSPIARKVTLQDGTVMPYEYLISTMPLPVLVKCIGDEAPFEVKQAASKLRYVSVKCVNLGVGREKLCDKHWIYYPEDTVFHRIFVQGNASPHCNAPGGTGITCEITYSEYKALPCDGQALIQRCIDDCKKVGMIQEGDAILAANVVDLPHAYVVYDHHRQKNVALIREWLADQNIILAGRYSEWEYYNSDHAFIAGKRAAEKVRQLMAQSAAQNERVSVRKVSPIQMKGQSD
jgi:UDP-galactopyranose mutase